MKGLILKDFYSFGNYKKNILLMLAIGVVLGVALDFVTIIPTYMIVLSTSYATGLFSYDETAHFERFAVTMPVTRKQTVLARYIVTLLALVVLTVAALAVSGLVVLIQGSGTEGLLTLLYTSAIMLVFSLLSLSILYPICYRFGAEKGRLAITLSFVIIFGGFMLLTAFFRDSLVSFFDNFLFYGIFIGIAVVALFLLSVVLSVRFYSKREF